MVFRAFDSLAITKIKTMKILRTFTCEITGTKCQIVELPNGNQVCQEVELPTPDEQEAEALCMEYLLTY